MNCLVNNSYDLELNKISTVNPPMNARAFI